MGDRLDLLVIGGGPGGYVAAIRAAQLGMRAACVDKESTLGGTCLNVGCIPSKALLDSSELYRQVTRGTAAHGIKTTPVGLDLAAMMARKDKVVRAGTQGIATLFKRNKIEWVRGKARFVSADEVVATGAEGERVLTASRVLIATGSEPTPLAGVPFDGERVISSTEALALRRVPERMLVIGAGAVGLELGSVWSRLGSQVTVVEFLDRIVPTMDREMGVQLQRALTKQGLTFRLETAATAVTPSEDGGARVTLISNGVPSEDTADLVLVAIGRRPYTEGLGAREIGVTFDNRGRIVVNEHYETSVAGVFAIGDVIEGPMLAHKAEDEGIAAVERMAGIPGHVNYEAIPNVVYTWPELASVGYSEQDAVAAGHEVRTGSFPFIANARARCMNETEGGVRIVADARTDRVLGVHVLGPHASEVIAEAVLAIEFGASAEDIARSSHAHPTLAEAMKEAALAVAGRAINV